MPRGLAADASFWPTVRHPPPHLTAIWRHNAAGLPSGAASCCLSRTRWRSPGTTLQDGPAVAATYITSFSCFSTLSTEQSPQHLLSTAVIFNFPTPFSQTSVLSFRPVLFSLPSLALLALLAPFSSAQSVLMCCRVPEWLNGGARLAPLGPPGGVHLLGNALTLSLPPSPHLASPPVPVRTPDSEALFIQRQVIRV